jgi:hypothetical protein
MGRGLLMYLKKAFKLVSKNLVLMVPVLVIGLISLFISNEHMQNLSNINTVVDPNVAIEMMGDIMGSLALYGLVMVIVSLLMQTGQAGMIKQALLNGQAGFSSFLQGIKRYFWRFVGQLLLLAAMAIAVTVVISIILVALLAGSAFANLVNDPAAAEQAANIGIGGVIAIAVIAIGVLIGGIFIMLWQPAMVIDDVGVFEGLRRGARAVSHHFWSLIGALLLINAIIIGISLGANYLYAVITGNSIGDISVVNYMSILGTLINSYLSAVLMAYLFIIYHNFRPADADLQPVEDSTVNIQPIDDEQNPPQPFDLPPDDRQ